MLWHAGNYGRLDNFSRFSARDNTKLRELSDLLLEILAAKNYGYLPGLTYLDTTRGIKPTAEKLPTNRQENGSMLAQSTQSAQRSNTEQLFLLFPFLPGLSTTKPKLKMTQTLS